MFGLQFLNNKIQIRMASICEHGNQITKFCLHETCTQKEPSGCDQCMAKFHNHKAENQYLSEKEILIAMKKYNLDPNLKPKCRTLQETIYSYFNKAKAQIAMFFDSLCKSLINEIGLPFLYKTNNWACYKKIKHKQYRKILPKELKRLMTQTIKTQKNVIIEKQYHLYFESITKMIKKFENFEQIFSSFQKIQVPQQVRFKHQKNDINKIKNLLANIQESKQLIQQYVNQLVKTQGRQQLKKPILISPRQIPLKSVSIQKRNRKLSIDNNIKKSRAFELKKIHIDHNDYQETNLKKSSTNKSLVCQVVKNKKDCDRPMKNSLYESNQRGKLSQMFEIKKNNNITQRSSSSEQKTQVQDQVKHTIIPQVQSAEKIYSPDLQINQKTITLEIEQINDQQCLSPLIKMKKQQKMSPKKFVEQLENKRNGQNSPSKQNLKDSQLRSLALLIKSIKMKSQEAVPHLQSAIRYASNNLTAAEYLSFLYLNMGRPKQCLALCNNILEQVQYSSQYDTLSHILCNNKGAAYNMLGRYSQAIVILKRCLQLKQQDISYKNLGDSYFSIGIYEKATQSYEKAIQLKQTNDEAYYNLAVCYYVQQELDNSDYYISKALQLNPKNTIYQQLKTQIKYKKGQF